MSKLSLYSLFNRSILQVLIQFFKVMGSVCFLVLVGVTLSILFDKVKWTLMLSRGLSDVRKGPHPSRPLSLIPLVGCKDRKVMWGVPRPKTTRRMSHEFLYRIRSTDPFDPLTRGRVPTVPSLSRHLPYLDSGEEVLSSSSPSTEITGLGKSLEGLLDQR